MSVEGHVGQLGQGKSYCMVARALEERERDDVVIFSNLRIPGCGYFETWDELMRILELAAAGHFQGKRVLILIDEAGVLLSSRFWQKMDRRILSMLQERRKMGGGVDIWYTVPAWRMIEPHLRDVTQRVWQARRVGGHEYSHARGKKPIAFILRAYWPEHMTVEHIGKRKRAKPHRTRVFWFCRQLASCYDTGVLDMAKPFAQETMARPDYELKVVS